MASVVSLLFVGFLVLAGEVIAQQNRGGEMVMEEEEILGLFEVMSALLEDPGWAELHPQPCTDTPWPGIQCEIGDQDPPIFHVTKIHIGPDVVTPPCKSSANLSDSLFKLPFLKTLSIFNCFLTSPVTLSPTLFSTTTSLEHLALVSNPALSGGIPPSISEIVSLRVLNLAQNNLQGEIPKEIGGLVNLEQLDLSYNNLSGEIPEEIGGLNGLTILDLSWNVIEGDLPSSLAQLPILQKIDLSSNRFVGRIPPELGMLNRLALFDLSSNFVNGPIPETLSGLENLEYLVVDHNPINAGMPLFIGTLRKLKSLSLSGCGLTGKIPNTITTMESLTALALDNNSLTGTIPPDLGALPNLDQLNLSHNQLSGQLQLPEEFIDRLGKRLDVRGNAGLCRSNQIYKKKNISTYLETPVCFNTTGPMNGKAFGDDQHPDDDDYERTKPSWHHDKMSSNAPAGMDQKLIFHSLWLSVFVVCFLIFLFALLGITSVICGMWMKKALARSLLFDFWYLTNKRS